MVLVDVYVPSLDAHYDYMVDENAPVSQVSAEIRQTISKKVRQKDRPEEEYMLCLRDRRQILPGAKTLAECKVTDGSSLILV